MKFKILLTYIFIYFLSSFAYSESISDINIGRLNEYEKTRWGRDPFIRFGQKEENLTKPARKPVFNIKIDGIISDGKKALVIINGNFYRVGDKIDDYEIRSISSERVLLENKGKKYYFGVEKFALDGGKK